MKTTKRVLAIVIAALMLAMMIPFSASAATSSFTLKCDKAGFEFSIIPLAKVNDTTGAYDILAGVTDDAVKTQLNKTNLVPADLLSACQTAYAASKLPAATDVFTATAAAPTHNYTKDNGIYFIKCTDQPLNAKEVLRDSILVLPLNDADKYPNNVVDLSSKVSILGEPKVEKDFKVGSTLTRAAQTYGSGEDITYVLTAEVTGSAQNHLTNYVISDTMGTGLDKGTIKIQSVILKSGSDETSISDYVVKKNTGVASTDITTIFTADDIKLLENNDDATTTGKTFGIFLGSEILGNDNFYKEGNKVIVTYKTKLASDAPINTDIPNQDHLAWQNSNGKNAKNGNTVVLKTYKIKAKKVDANSTTTGVAGATFTLYEKVEDTSAASGYRLVSKGTATSVAGGTADFNLLLKAGTYVVQETDAPEGYMLNTTPSADIVLGDGNDDDEFTVTIADTKVKLPDTGGEGTMMFTIIGGSLILLAGALFVVVMKKRASK